MINALYFEKDIKKILQKHLCNRICFTFDCKKPPCDDFKKLKKEIILSGVAFS